MKSLISLLFSCIAVVNTIAQTYTFSNTTAANINSTATTSRNMTITGVPTSGQVLRQVNVDFGNNTSLYSGDMAKFTLTLTDPNGNVVTLLNSAEFTTTSSSSNKRFNIKFRDHFGLMTPKEQQNATSSTLSKGYPFNQGYYAPVGSFASFNTTTNVNGTWTFKMSGYNTSYGRTFNSVELIFGPPIIVTDIRATAANTSCGTRKCFQTGDVFLAKNSGFPTGQASAPGNTVGGCAWNGQKDNMAWFFFLASGTTAQVSLSGLSTVQESSVFKTTDCSNYTIVAGGCGKNDLFANNAVNSNGYKYYNGSYAGGYAWNQEYKLSGLVSGEEYLLVIDGQAGTSSDFYVEIISGGDFGCSIILPVELQDFSATCTSKNLKINWSTVSEINNETFQLQVSQDGEIWENIGNVSGKGNSSETVHYHFDKPTSELPPFKYCRISQKDYDGTKSIISKTVAVKCENENSFLIYPNPSFGEVSVQRESSDRQLIEIFDYKGQLVHNSISNTQNTSIRIDNPGYYLIKIGNEIKPIVIQ